VPTIIIAKTIEDVIKKLNDREMLSILVAAIDNTLGINSSRLVFRALETVYDFSVTPLSIRKGEFDKLLAKLVGVIAYHHIVHSIISETSARKMRDNYEGR
jgi:hypothetical protein